MDQETKDKYLIYGMIGLSAGMILGIFGYAAVIPVIVGVVVGFIVKNIIQKREAKKEFKEEYGLTP